jgi:hypothetical protein
MERDGKQGTRLVLSLPLNQNPAQERSA